MMDFQSPTLAAFLTNMVVSFLYFPPQCYPTGATISITTAKPSSTFITRHIPGRSLPISPALRRTKPMFFYMRRATIILNTTNITGQFYFIVLRMSLSTRYIFSQPNTPAFFAAKTMFKIFTKAWANRYCSTNITSPFKFSCPCLVPTGCRTIFLSGVF